MGAKGANCRELPPKPCKHTTKPTGACLFAGGTEMKFKDNDFSPKLDWVGALPEEEPLLQAFNSSVVERVAVPRNIS
jgi:hypothetical protein